LFFLQVAFPEPGESKDIVSLRGPKEDVDKCATYLKKLGLELVKMGNWLIIIIVVVGDPLPLPGSCIGNGRRLHLWDLAAATI
jgi:hypothetical protein